MYCKPTIKATFLLLFCCVQATISAQNLLKNPDCELPMSNGKIPFWTNTTGNLWHARAADPIPQNGAFCFSPGQIKSAELSQIVDVSDYACAIDAGIQRFVFNGYVYSDRQEPLDIARVLVEYLSVTNVVLTTYDSGDKSPIGVWEQLTNTTRAPVGTRKLRIRLLSTRRYGTDNDGDYDNLSITPSPAKVVIDTVQITSAKCDKPNGKLIVKTSGGANLTFKINNGTATTDSIFSNISGGNYTLEVTSGNCTVSKSVTVPTTVPPTIDSLKIDPSVCSRANGKITIFGRSNYQNLTYSIDSTVFRNIKTFDSLATNVYKITLRDSFNCVFQQSITVTDKPAPTINSLKEAPSVCSKNNGKLTAVVAIGGTSPLSFSIDSVRFSSIPTFDSLKSGTYKLIVRDSNGCTASRAFEIKRFDAPNITAVDITPPSCKGGDGILKVAASSTAPPLGFSLDSARFTPKDTFFNLKSGIFVVSVRDSFGCVAKQNVSMPDPKLPIIEAIQASVTECGQASASIIVNAKSPVGSVKYSLDTVNFQVENTFKNVKKGKYRVIVEDSKGCRATAEAAVSSNCTVFIPNIFSPNGDGKNDFLSLFGNADDVEKILVFQIYNRWGELIFNDPTIRLNDPTSGWNGRMNNQDLSNDVFVCVVKVQMRSGEILDKMGDVLLNK